MGLLALNCNFECIANGGAGASLLKESVNEGEIPFCYLQSSVHGIYLASHTPRHWNAKWVVNSM